MTRWLIQTEDRKCAWSVDTWDLRNSAYRWVDVA